VLRGAEMWGGAEPEDAALGDAAAEEGRSRA
jgi:hypothetical protein